MTPASIISTDHGYEGLEMRYVVEAISRSGAFGPVAERRSLIHEIIDADDPEAAVRWATKRCSVLDLTEGVELVAYELGASERWRFQYERPDGELFAVRRQDGRGEIVGVRQKVKAGSNQ